MPLPDHYFHQYHQLVWHAVYHCQGCIVIIDQPHYPFHPCCRQGQVMPIPHNLLPLQKQKYNNALLVTTVTYHQIPLQQHCSTV